MKEMTEVISKPGTQDTCMIRDPPSRAWTQTGGSMHSSVLLDTGLTHPGTPETQPRGALDCLPEAQS